MKPLTTPAARRRPTSPGSAAAVLPISPPPRTLYAPIMADAADPKLAAANSASNLNEQGIRRRAPANSEQFKQKKKSKLREFAAGGLGEQFKVVFFSG
jgi:hypothetical protein